MRVLRWAGALLLLLPFWVLLAMPALGMVLTIRAAPAGVLASLPQPPADLAQQVQGDGRVQLGRCYRERVGALTHIHLEGGHAELGFWQGALVGASIARIEQEMMGVFTERVPSFAARHLLLGLVNWNNRTLESHFLPDELAEIAAITEGHRRYHDPYDAVSPAYSRGLQYHALHDISQYLIDNPLVHPPQVGCTAVAVGISRSAEQHVLVGRLFDFEGGSCFDRDKVVYTVRPDGGIPFVSIAWGGMAGAVTGINDAGLWVSINAAATDGQAFVGRPIVMVVRQVLEHCRTIDEAIAIIKTADIFVSNGVLLASGTEQRVVVVERGPKGFGVRPMRDDALVLTNHFLSEPWKDDHANAARIANGTTTKRSARAEKLLADRRHHTPASLLAILRDHRGAGGEDVGFGNRGTINAWIGAHLVVADVSAKVLWVCEPYHGLGRAIPFGIDGPLGREPLPADPELALHEERGDDYRKTEQQVQALLAAGRRAEARPLAAHLIELNPRFFGAYELAAQSAEDPVLFRQHLEKALELQPAYPADEQAIRAKLGK